MTLVKKKKVCVFFQCSWLFKVILLGELLLPIIIIIVLLLLMYV